MTSRLFSFRFDILLLSQPLYSEEVVIDAQLVTLEGWSALLTVPQLTRAWLPRQANARKVEPFVKTGCVVAGDHISIADIVTEAISWFLAGSCRNAIGRTSFISLHCG